MIRELARSAAIVTTNLPPSQFSYFGRVETKRHRALVNSDGVLPLFHSCVHDRGASVHMDGDDTVDCHPRNFFNRFRHGRRRL